MTIVPDHGKPRILIINRSYPPGPGATGRIVRDLAEDLTSEFDVTVLAGPLEKRDKSDAKAARNTVDEAATASPQQPRVIRAAGTTLGKGSMLGRIADLTSFLMAVTLRGLCLGRPDIVLVMTDPPMLCLTGALLKFRFGAKLVIHIQDLHPDVGVAIGKLKDSFLTRCISRAFRISYRRADRVWAVSRDMRDELASQGIQTDRLEYVPNWSDGRFIEPLDSQAASEANGSENLRPFRILYSGNIGLTQPLDQLVDAADLLRHRPDIEIVISGDGAGRPALEQRLRGSSSNIRLMHPSAEFSLSEHLSTGDLHFVPLAIGVDRFLMPSKLYAAMASARPVLVTGRAGTELVEIVRSAGLGFVAPPDDAACLARRIEQAADLRETNIAMGQRSRRLFEARFDRPPSTERIRRRLRALISRDETVHEAPPRPKFVQFSGRWTISASATKSNRRLSD
ncbi:glycosyltransferase family 4 protein [Stratiformator vulcanicus]|uniref:Glycosyltransferase EpsD n=1 Tax=Stratiformator vulcanicus TaxID=2527980 RepID=A0A517QXI8_9PLAN|nr:glycosyltransferase family 4 protein [Stratiformator vulcanicus]QDT36376.1 Putative glycosyltransferase EpsD [Stratiformator vulcanicus]